MMHPRSALVPTRPSPESSVCRSSVFACAHVHAVVFVGACALIVASFASCGDDAGGGRPCAPEPVVAPACGQGPVARDGLLPGPADPGYDEALAQQAWRLERQYHTFNAHGTGVNTEVVVPRDATSARADILAFLEQDDGWDFQAYAGRPVTDVVSAWRKVAGAYAGVGIAADAFRYGVLRDEGADCDEVEQARIHVRRSLEALHLAVAITGEQGVIARGFARRDLPGTGPGIETTPLFDADGLPLPTEKDNGTWREDNSGGLYPDVVWEDSCSRDQYVGWVVGFAALWEVIGADPTFPDDVKERLQRDAAALARSLMQVGKQGYDLEIPDADGRVTYHGYLHEEAIERTYLTGFENGFHALMALGIVAGLAYVAEQPDIDAYLQDRLILARDLPGIARRFAGMMDLGLRTNFSNYNMLFAGGWLASRYLCDDPARATVNEALWHAVYEQPGEDRQPAEQAQSLFDFVYVAARAGGTAVAPLGADVDEQALARGVQTLRELAEAPYYEPSRINCDATEIQAGVCEAVDGSALILAGSGHNDELVAEDPLPMRIRPGSNYHWRSNPYRVNGGGDGSRLLSGVDFRIAYWMARWMRRSPP
jgi:hypothetical protein